MSENNSGVEPSLTSQEGIAQPHTWKCPACYREGDPTAVQVRQPDRTWANSTIQRCPNDECWHTFGGSLADHITHLNDVYAYKYFGDYELSPEQFDAVWNALSLARQVPGLVEALKGLAAPMASEGVAGALAIHDLATWANVGEALAGAKIAIATAEGALPDANASERVTADAELAGDGSGTNEYFPSKGHHP